MNKATKKWYKEAQTKCQESYNIAEATGWGADAHQEYLLEMTEIAEYYILACNFDLPGFDCNNEED